MNKFPLPFPFSENPPTKFRDTKIGRIESLTLDEVLKLKYGTPVSIYHTGNNRVNVMKCIFYRVYKNRMYLFNIQYSFEYERYLSDTGLIPYENGNWNGYNFISLDIPNAKHAYCKAWSVRRTCIEGCIHEFRHPILNGSVNLSCDIYELPSPYNNNKGETRYSVDIGYTSAYNLLIHTVKTYHIYSNDLKTVKETALNQLMSLVTLPKE